MKIEKILENTNLKSKKNFDIKGICYDSREAAQDFIFFAIKGEFHDGHNFIDDVIKNGAKCIVCEYIPKEYQNYSGEIEFIVSSNIKKDLSRACFNFYENPLKDMISIGVTGTDGKTSITYYTYQMLNYLGFKTGFFSTAIYDIDGHLQDNSFRQSTPESLDCFKFFTSMKKNNMKCSIMEATSHALSPEYSRLVDVDFQVGIISQIGHEHMDFHKTKEKYRSDKANVFRQLKKKGDFMPFALINFDDKDSLDYLIETAKTSGAEYYTFSTENSRADFYASDVKSTLEGNSFNLNYNGTKVLIESLLLGSFFISNMIPVIAAVHKITGKSIQEIAPIVKNIKNPSGRMELLEKNGIKVLVDYAHTPKSFEIIFPFFRNICHGDLIAVFGSGGNRDIQKRQMLGKIASKYANKLYLTDEDPREEKGMDIIDEIERGVSNNTTKVFKIEDRFLAIEEAIKNSKAGDLILCLGKGHEKCIFYSGGKKIAWNEKQAVIDVLAKI